MLSKTHSILTLFPFCQVVNNIAYVVIEETAPGSQVDRRIFRLYVL
jgi:hypothetical protein